MAHITVNPPTLKIYRAESGSRDVRRGPIPDTLAPPLPTCRVCGTRMNHDENTPSPLWRTDADALAFQPECHRGLCFVHRLAFRSLLGDARSAPGGAPAPADCEAYFSTHHSAFQRAAAEKIARTGTPSERNFHLNSRDIRRALPQTPSPPDVSD